MVPPMGRPKSEKPKTIEIKARIDKETDSKVQEYCEKHKVSRTDVVRKGIELVLNEKK